jgi:hypothetical protein
MAGDLPLISAQLFGVMEIPFILPLPARRAA